MAHNHDSFSIALANDAIESCSHAKHKLSPILPIWRYLAERRLSKVYFTKLSSILIYVYSSPYTITQLLHFIVEKNRQSQRGSDDFSRLASALERTGDKHISSDFARSRQSVAQAFSLEYA